MSRNGRTTFPSPNTSPPMATAPSVPARSTSSWRGPKKNETNPEFQEAGPAGGPGPEPPQKLVANTPFGNNPLVDWGVWPLDNDDSSKGDHRVASWAVEKLESLPKEQPFFLAAGFFLPHVPCYSTQKWHDLYPNDASILPAFRPDDRDDTPAPHGGFTGASRNHAGNGFRTITKT